MTLCTQSGLASAARVMLHVTTRGEAHGDGEAALLRLVETLVGLLGVSQPAQRRRPGGQRIGAIA
jgi:hypothetical protein